MTYSANHNTDVYKLQYTLTFRSALHALQVTATGSCLMFGFGSRRRACLVMLQQMLLHKMHTSCSKAPGHLLHCNQVQVKAVGSCHSLEGLKLDWFEVKANGATLWAQGDLLGAEQKASFQLSKFPVGELEPVFRCACLFSALCMKCNMSLRQYSEK